MNRGNQTNAQNVYKSQDKFLKYWSLELQLLEEPPVLAALVTLLELGPHHVPCLFLLHGVLQQFLVEVGLVETDVHGVASRHHVVVVDDLQERLNLGPLLDLLFGHLLGDLAGILVNPGHQSVAGLKGLSLVPSSEGFPMTAFRPAYLPDSSRTTFPLFIILPMMDSLVEVNQAIKAWAS